MGLVEHARRELIACGQYDEDPAYSQSLISAVAAFASYGHSGGSAAVGIGQLCALLNYETLSPLTDDPDEWVCVAEQSGTDLWQSARNPQAFSTDGGATYCLLHECEDPPILFEIAPRHVSAPARKPKLPDESVAPPCQTN